jgi:hypothetical protein
VTREGFARVARTIARAESPAPITDAYVEHLERESHRLRAALAACATQFDFILAEQFDVADARALRAVHDAARAGKEASRG